VIHARDGHGMSERQACRVVKQPRGTQRFVIATGLLGTVVGIAGLFIFAATYLLGR
jgi:hypothetical protein